MERKYRLPFTGPVIISQGKHGIYDHRDGIKPNIDLSGSVDFKMPFGSEVLAARDGELWIAMNKIGDWYPGKDVTIGQKSLSNFLMILHPDKEISLYSHIKPKNIERGRQIKVGELIGWTDRTGWVPKNCPHLHFQVVVRKDKRFINVDWDFNNYSGPIEDIDIRKRN